MIKREYYKQLYTHEFNEVEEMDQMLKKSQLPKSNQDKIDILNSPITIKETEYIM